MIESKSNELFTVNTIFFFRICVINMAGCQFSKCVRLITRHREQAIAFACTGMTGFRLSLYTGISMVVRIPWISWGSECEGPVYVLSIFYLISDFIVYSTICKVRIYQQAVALFVHVRYWDRLSSKKKGFRLYSQFKKLEISPIFIILSGRLGQILTKKIVKFLWQHLFIGYDAPVINFDLALHLGQSMFDYIFYGCPHFRYCSDKLPVV